MSEQVVVGVDGVARCWWAGQDGDYVAYHDDEWGRPEADDERLFEKLCLESFQSGLAWITVLRKRAAFRERFHGFDPERVAAMGPGEVEQLLADPAIIRHRGKIESAINNAARTLTLQEEVGSLAGFVWSYEPERSGPPADPPASRSPESEALATALKRRGFTWLGPTTIYAFMQAMGLVNDHVPGCHLRAEIDSTRATFPRP